MPPIKWKRVLGVVLLILLFCNLDDLLRLWERCAVEDRLADTFDQFCQGPPPLVFLDLLLLFALFFLAAYKIAMAWASKPRNYLHIHMDKKNVHPAADGQPERLPDRDGYGFLENRPAARSSTVRTNRLRDTVTDQSVDTQVVESPTMESGGAQDRYQPRPSMIERVLSNLNN